MQSQLQSLARGFKPLHLKLFISNKYAYAQVVRLPSGDVMAAASTIERPLREAKTKRGVDSTDCSKVGELLAERAKTAGVEGVHWPRKRGQRYHGRIAALIASMQEAGVKLV